MTDSPSVKRPESSVFGEDSFGQAIPLPDHFFEQNPQKIIPGTELSIGQCTKADGESRYEGPVEFVGITYGEVLAAAKNNILSLGEARELLYNQQSNLSSFFDSSCLAGKKIYSNDPLQDNVSLNAFISILRNINEQAWISQSQGTKNLKETFSQGQWLQGAKTLFLGGSNSLSINHFLEEIGLRASPFELSAAEKLAQTLKQFQQASEWTLLAEGLLLGTSVAISDLVATLLGSKLAWGAVAILGFKVLAA
ncbi:MAG: hypothetical protein KDK66_09595, partial [Deltaproteobacteria bacterium]|nr:hypothetical protein [Deltaproteobacteria bacterium]